jgi:hypothetical protein
MMYMGGRFEAPITLLSLSLYILVGNCNIFSQILYAEAADGKHIAVLYFIPSPVFVEVWRVYSNTSPILKGSLQNVGAE